MVKSEKSTKVVADTGARGRAGEATCPPLPTPWPLFPCRIMCERAVLAAADMTEYEGGERREACGIVVETRQTLKREI